MSNKTTIVISEGRNDNPARRKLQEDLTTVREALGIDEPKLPF